MDFSGVTPPSEHQRESLSSRCAHRQSSIDEGDPTYESISPSYNDMDEAPKEVKGSVGLGLGMNPFTARHKVHHRHTSSGSLTTPLVGRGTPPRSIRHMSSESGGDWLGTTPPSQPSQLSEINLLGNMDQPRSVPTPNSYEEPLDRKVLESPSSGGYTNDLRCPTHGKVLQRRLSWLSVSILALAIYSTIFSGIYVVVAFVKPRFGMSIGDTGLAPSTASLLSALFAKTVELSFVTVFVAFLGQVLSRRAISNQSRGITIADMSMRAWIMQPGTLITHWETVKYASLTVLGVIALMATFVAMLYTTAADALVSPKLSFGHVEETFLYGQVSTQFANPLYLEEHCETPIPDDVDNEYRGSTCLQITHVGQAYHNYQQYITGWSGLVKTNHSLAPSFLERPNPTGIIYDNTTIEGSWIEIADMEGLSKKYGRMINNVTAAMPHAGVFAAARDPANSIRQPKDVSGLGEYRISASVPSPSINVMCAGMSKDELAPLIYSEWPDSNGKFNASTWNTTPPGDIPAFPDWLNRTVVDEIFDFGKERGQRPPIFPKFPAEYNTLVNVTGTFPANAIYVIGAPPSSMSNPEYVMCSLKAKLSTQCSTRYHASMIGGSLTSVCEDENDHLAYHVSTPDVPVLDWTVDWKNIGSEWANSLSLSIGIIDGAAANARLLTQMIPPYDTKTKTSSLNPKLPSIAEALATMAGSTLLMSSQNSPFVHFWNYSTPTLEPPEYQGFKATLQVQDYASGGSEEWQRAFYIVLVIVFLTNIVCLVYMFLEVRGRQMTDFTEPQNLFTLAMNSPATSRLRGACGAGPEGHQFKERWFVGMEERDEHYFIRTKAEEYASQQAQEQGQDQEGTTHGTVYRDRSKFTESFEMSDSLKKASLSPAVTEFRRLSRKRDSLL